MKTSLKKIVFLSSLGNALEFYDFTITAVFIPILAKIFFPSLDPAMAIFAGFFAFGAGFIGRPFGAYLFGLIGDRYGRKYALSLTVGLMGIPTGAVALLPGYAEWGLISPIILIFCRLIQGLCTGGEYNGAAVFALEHDGGKNAGLVSGTIVASAIVGALLATCAGKIVLSEGMPDWAWRVPFLVGSLISFVAYFVRKNLAETKEFQQIKKEKHTQQPLAEIWTNLRPQFCLNILYAFVTGVLFYTIFGFLNVYMSRFVGLSLQDAVHYNTYGLISFMASCVFFGHLSDKIGLRKALFLPVILIFCGSILTFFLLQHSIILGEICLGILCGSYLAPGHCFMLNLFPPHARYTGTSLSFSIGMAMAGVTTPAALTYMIDQSGNLFIPAFYMMFFVTAMGLTLRQTAVAKRV